MIINRNQVVMPTKLEIQIPSDDPVRRTNKICDELDYTKVYAVYDRAWRKVYLKTMFKIIVYRYINELYTSRDI